MSSNSLVTAQHLTGVLKGFKDYVDEKIDKKSDSTVFEPAEDDLPLIFIDGDTPIDKTDVSAEIVYQSKTDRFKAYLGIKLQGNSTLAYPKRNYTITMYSNKEHTEKFNKNFRNWGLHNNYVLKADYIDIMHARNVVSARLWGKIAKDVEYLPTQIQNAPNYGAIDGFPVKVFYNGKCKGIYTLTIPKCDWLVGMDKYNSSHVLLCSEFNDNGDWNYQYNPCNFNANWDGSEQYFSASVGTVTPELVGNFNLLVASDSSRNAHLNINNVIDYHILQDVILGTDGLAKNMLLTTFDKGLNWNLLPYDMDATFGLDWHGEFDENSTTIGLGDVEKFNNTYSRLTEVIRNLQTTVNSSYIKRFFELRKTALSYESIMGEFERFTRPFGEDEYIKDTVQFPDIPSPVENNIKSLEDFIWNRVNYLETRYYDYT